MGKGFLSQERFYMEFQGHMTLKQISKPLGLMSKNTDLKWLTLRNFKKRERKMLFSSDVFP